MYEGEPAIDLREFIQEFVNAWQEGSRKRSSIKKVIVEKTTSYFLQSTACNLKRALARKEC